MHIDQDKCSGCGSCIEGCQNNAIRLDENNKVYIEIFDCVECLACIDVCLMMLLTKEIHFNNYLVNRLSYHENWKYKILKKGMY
ncbi:MAG: 4Fe-4S binding protein [Erysipelotrichaceae bacterium]